MNRNPRSERQIEWLRKFYDVEYVARIPNPSLEVPFIEHCPEKGLWNKWRLLLLKLRLYDSYIWDRSNVNLIDRIKNKKYDLIIVHHLKLLPIAFAFAQNAKVIFDAHEYYTEMYNDSPLWNFFMKKYYNWISHTYINRCNMVIAVNESMQRLYERHYHTPATFITNASNYAELQPIPTDYNNIKIIHHGLASRSRKLELMIEMAKFLDERFTLTLILQKINYSSRKYVDYLAKLAAGSKKIIFMDIIPQRDLIRFCNNYDIGLFFMPPSNINEEYSLANKFFQYIQSRLMLAVSPLPEMKRLVELYDLGVVSTDYNAKSMADALNMLTPVQIMHHKKMSHVAATSLSSEANKSKFLQLISEILN